MRTFATRSLTWSLLGLAVLLTGCPGRGEDRAGPGHDTRPAAVAGAFYPGQAGALRQAVQGLLDAAPTAVVTGRIVAAVAPHAGYVFSGAVAACTWKPLADLDADTIVIIGHDTHRPGRVAFVGPFDSYATPLGRVAVDREMAEALVAADPGIHADRALHAAEHSIEVQLPFLQVLGLRCRIVPILFGSPSPEHCERLARAIDAAAGSRKVFVLASSDLSHYPPYEQACAIDRAGLAALKTLDLRTFLSALGALDATPGVPRLETAMCSRGGVGTALAFARAHGADRVEILRYANSGDAKAGGRDRVVGYGSALFLAEAVVPEP